ncbi:MAG TPA: hypothetical protein VHV10_12730 [Ktedonobacteraceae bacterium]|jgi:hypothetical protein|nr:hypothetical protein [Ktedonobacteraceae bacterium]
MELLASNEAQLLEPRDARLDGKGCAQAGFDLKNSRCSHQFSQQASEAWSASGQGDGLCWPEKAPKHQGPETRRDQIPGTNASHHYFDPSPDQFHSRVPMPFRFLMDYHSSGATQ